MVAIGSTRRCLHRCHRRPSRRAILLVVRPGDAAHRDDAACCRCSSWRSSWRAPASLQQDDPGDRDPLCRMSSCHRAKTPKLCASSSSSRRRGDRHVGEAHRDPPRPPKIFALIAPATVKIGLMILIEASSSSRPWRAEVTPSWAARRRDRRRQTSACAWLVIFRAAISFVVFGTNLVGRRAARTSLIYASELMKLVSSSRGAQRRSHSCCSARLIEICFVRWMMSVRRECASGGATVDEV